MNIIDLHSWDVDYKQAVALQVELAGHVRQTKLRKTPKLIGGVDCAFTRDGHSVIACVVVLQLLSLHPIEIRWAAEPLKFPYIPGLLSFREAPACIAAARKLQSVPDVFIVDGQGIAHPRRFGIASHLGLFFDRPTIGCAKSRLIGQYAQPDRLKGSWTPLQDGKTVIGAVLRTKNDVRPVFVSVGHKICLDDAVNVCLCATGSYRLPEPTRLADRKVAELKRTGATTDGA